MSDSSKPATEAPKQPAATATAKTPHLFQIRFFAAPVLCAHCRDYIWGEGYLGFGCVQCGACVHTRCKLFTVTSECSRNTTSDNSLDARTKSAYFAVADWPILIVKEWLAVVNLHRYAEIFATYNITGAKLLALDIYQLYAFRIRDSYHHAAILQARDELVYRGRHFCNAEKLLSEQDHSKTHLLANQYKPDNHHFLMHTLSSLVDCDMCRRPLLGIVHQCMACQRCGLLVHRQCACTGLPKCQQPASSAADQDQQKHPVERQRHSSSKHFIFGVSLFDLMSTNPNEPPVILTKCFREIEDRATSTNDDLYDVYRLSADTSKIDAVKQSIEQLGCDLVQLAAYDLNTLAALVKTFLRDLQNSVIPEEMYMGLVARIQHLTSDELRMIVAEHLPPVHAVCLRHVMAHLIRVWCYQYKVRGCHYLPDKLFHIFRSILMRPPWDKITQIVYNIDNQTLVIQRLMLECNWGNDVDLPEYKIRPKRPMNPSLSVDNIVGANQPDNTSKRMTNIAKQVSGRPSLPSSMSATSSLSSSESSSSLNEMPWYWSDLSRDDTILVLKNCPDGSFLVRNSSDRAHNAPYTLCVMKGAFVKSIKIFRQEQQQQQNAFVYDIEKPCRFESVSTLVAYYSKVSLKEYNHNLDLVLTYGVSKYKFGKTTEWSLDKLYAQFRDAYHEFQQATKKYDGLEAEIGYVREDMAQKKTACEAFEKIIGIYNAQIEQVDKVLNECLLRRNQTVSSARLLAASIMPVMGISSSSSSKPTSNTSSSGSGNNESSKDNDDDDVDSTKRMMNANRVKLTQRIDELTGRRDEVRTDIDYLSRVMAQLQEELDLLRPELIELRKKRENYHMWLLQRGENDDKIQTRLKEDMKNVGASVSDIEIISPQSTSTTSQPNQYHQIKPSSSMQNLENLGPIVEDNGTTTPSKQDEHQQSMATKYANMSIDEHSNSLNWYVAECDRARACALLDKQPNGTYLVRPDLKQTSNAKYILSLVHENEIKHILIDEDATGCFIKSNFASRNRFHSLGKTSIKSELGNIKKAVENEINRHKSTSTAYSAIGSLIVSAANSPLAGIVKPASSTSVASDKNDYVDNDDAASEVYVSGVGAGEQAPKFKTLTDLVCFYSQHAIVVDGFHLNMMLRYPVLANNRQDNSNIRF